MLGEAYRLILCKNRMTVVIPCALGLGCRGILGEDFMDLGIKGKKAIVCASSRGLGRGCAAALAEAGCDIVINGRDANALAATAAELRNRFGVNVAEVAADVSTHEGQKALLSACPDPDILVNNNAGPPLKDFRQLDRKAMLDGVTQNMVTPLELIQLVVDGMTERRFGRIVNITSLSVYVPIAGLDLSSGARAGLTAFLAGVCRTVADKNVTINNLLPGKLDTDRLASNFRAGAARAGITIEEEQVRQVAVIPAKRLGTPEEFGQICAFLCSVHAGYLTGQNIPVDGGLYTSAF
jgi:3-oxoacyl-[acyl-carrier protein] reductase